MFSLTKFPSLIFVFLVVAGLFLSIILGIEKYGADDEFLFLLEAELCCWDLQLVSFS